LGWIDGDSVDRNLFDDLKSESMQAGIGAWMIAEDAQSAQAQIAQNLAADADQIFRFVQSRAAQSMTRQAIFAEVQRLAEAAYLAATGRPSPIDIPNYNPSLLLAPRLTEPWYC
jgi:hypothetical protein